MSLLDVADVAPLDRPKAEDALGRVRLERVRSDGPAFAAAYDLLDAFFGPRGEMEERAAIAGFVREPVIPFGPGLEGVYHLVAAWDGDTLVGVRDCYVDIDHTAGVCVVALSHSLVVPAWRRSGLAAVMRALPVTLARRVLAERVGRQLPMLIAGEMEPVDPDNFDTVVRLVAYGRSGFVVLDPPRFRYSQPEFRDLPGAAHTGIPLLGVVRPIGFGDSAGGGGAPGRASGAPGVASGDVLGGASGDVLGGAPASLPAEIMAAYPRLFHGCHRTYLPAERVDPSQRHVEAHLGTEPVRLLPLPTGGDTLDRLAPLVRGAVLPLYPPGLRGPDPGFGDPAEEMARVRAGWRG